jgi:magnesium transporter
MADAGALTLAFLRAHPADAARVLETAEPAGRAELFRRIPARVGGEVLAQLPPRSAAQTLSALPDERATELLARMGVQRAVAVLQHIDEPRRSQLIGGLPTASALATKLLIGYPEDAVGAHMDPAVLALPPGASAADALHRAIHAERTLERIFVVDDGGRLLGWLPLDELLRAPQAAMLESLRPRSAAVLAAQTPLAGAATHPGWHQASILPVVDRGNRLVGELTRDALERALHAARSSAAPPHPLEDSIGGVVARSYWHGLSGILRVLLSLLPPVAPVARRREG